MAALGAKQLPAAVNSTRLLARIQASDHVGTDLVRYIGSSPRGRAKSLDVNTESKIRRLVAVTLGYGPSR